MAKNAFRPYRTPLRNGLMSSERPYFERKHLYPFTKHSQTSNATLRRIPSSSWQPVPLQSTSSKTERVAAHRVINVKKMHMGRDTKVSRETSKIHWPVEVLVPFSSPPSSRRTYSSLFLPGVMAQDAQPSYHVALKKRKRRTRMM